jgi:hypothetical protein
VKSGSEREDERFRTFSLRSVEEAAVWRAGVQGRWATLYLPCTRPGRARRGRACVRLRRGSRLLVRVGVGVVRS